MGTDLLSAPDEDLILRPEQILAGLDAAFHASIQADLSLMGFILSAERQGLPAADGYRSTEEWLSARLGIGYIAACVKVNAARCLRELPEIRRAYAQGRISWDHVRALIEVAGRDTEHDLLGQTESRTVSDAWKLVNKIKAVSAEDSADARQERFLEMRWDLASRHLMLYGNLPEEMGARFEKAIDSAMNQLPADSEATAGMRRADALVALSSAAISEMGDKANIVVHIDHQALVTEVGNGSFEGGSTTSVATVKRLACDSVMQLVVHGHDGDPIAVGARSRTIPRWLRTQLIRRDVTCRFPGCRSKRQLDGHHIDPWPGPTSYDNLVLLCRFHHGKVHELGWKVMGKAPDIWIERPNAPPLRPGPPPLI